MYSVAGKTYEKKFRKLEKIIVENLEKIWKNIVFSDLKISVLWSFFISKKLLNKQLFKINPVFKTSKFPKAIPIVFFSHNYLNYYFMKQNIFSFEFKFFIFIFHFFCLCRAKHGIGSKHIPRLNLIQTENIIYLIYSILVILISHYI